MKVIRDLFFFLLLGLLFSGAFAKGSEDATHSLTLHPAFHLQISNFDKNVQHDKATVHPKIDKVSSPHRMLFPQAEPEFLDTTMSQRDVVTPMTTVPTINPSTTTPTYNPLPTPANPTPTTYPYTTPANPDTTPTNPATNPYTTPTTNPNTTPTNPATNPYTTPTTNPNPTPTNPATNPYTTPTTNPNTTPTNPYTTPTTGNPTSPTPTMGNPTSSSGQSWCVASPSASQTALQVALDYACGYGGADCSAIQQGGSCFNPDTVRDHASYAFNSYYQKNPVPTSCDFGGTAIITNTDPSTSTCQFPSSSTSSSTLNTTNPTGGGSPVYGSSPFGSSPFGSSPPDYNDTNSSSIKTPSSFTLICFLISLIYLKVYK